jgi:hypothetical protein
MLTVRVTKTIFFDIKWSTWLEHFIYKESLKHFSFTILHRLVDFSTHPKARHGSAFEFDFWRLSDLSSFRMVGPFYICIYIYINIHIYIQRSRLNRPSCFYHLKAGKKIVREMTVRMSDCSAFGGILYLKTGQEIGWLKNIWKPDINCVRKMTIWKPGCPVLNGKHLKSGHLNTKNIKKMEFVSGIQAILAAIFFNHLKTGQCVRFMVEGPVFRFRLSLK